MIIKNNQQTQVKNRHLWMDERIWFISMRLDCHHVDTIIQQWPFPCKPSSPQAIYDLIRKVKYTGSVVDQVGRGPPITVDTFENRQLVIQFVERYRSSSIMEMAEELSLSESYVHRVLRGKF